ncbi:MAG: hypothetical protein NWE89_16505 [Candidatus Bathyarchaeota archaeon]|nr:hypothetical protein [Candidatus Bathyarchaeota archaeon]
MQAKDVGSKPLALVLIGLIIGTSLGMGSGYALFLPGLVNQRNRTIEERLDQLEDDIQDINSNMGSMNSSIRLINENLEGIITLSDTINDLGDSISAVESSMSIIETSMTIMENSLNSLEGDVNDMDDRLDSVENIAEAIEESMTELNSDYDVLQSDLADLLADLNDLRSSFSSADSQLSEIQNSLTESLVVETLRISIANPSQVTLIQMSNSLYDELIDGDADFSDLVTDFGESYARIVLGQAVESMTGGLVWNKVSVGKLGSDTYQVKLESYFDFVIQSANVNIPNIKMEIRATVNIETREVTQLTITDVEIV